MQRDEGADLMILKKSVFCVGLRDQGFVSDLMPNVLGRMD